MTSQIPQIPGLQKTGRISPEEKAERVRVHELLKDASISAVRAFARTYEGWPEICFPGRKIENSRVAKPGDIVYEIKNTPWQPESDGERFRRIVKEAAERAQGIIPGDMPDLCIYIGSARTGSATSTRLIIRLKDRTLRRAHNIRNVTSDANFQKIRCTCLTRGSTHRPDCYWLKDFLNWKRIRRMVEEVICDR